VLWAWVESKPGVFNFDDYDRLAEISARNGLNVVLSTIAEIQPYWIHKEVPGSEMFTNMGHKVVSSNRGETHFGLTPGGCTDHPEVWGRMKQFLEQTAAHYKDLPNLTGWDAWNELRWQINADGLVCYCEHTLKDFRSWLMEKYETLDNLNKIWKRRYGNLVEIQPGKCFRRTYTEMMAFQHFITQRSNQHALNRYQTIKEIDRIHPVTIHGGAPSPYHAGSPDCTALERGNDWFHADNVDGIGTSSFPAAWGGMDFADFALRLEFIQSAARDKRIWISELQGGRSAIGFDIAGKVDGLSQQRWLWNGLAIGAETILFWCWRDEIFGIESGGFGLNGYDGDREDRLKYLKQTSGILNENQDVFEHYKPDKGDVGVWFSPQTYYLNSSLSGRADES